MSLEQYFIKQKETPVSLSYSQERLFNFWVVRKFIELTPDINFHPINDGKLVS
jgi:hypothetical protein